MILDSAEGPDACGTTTICITTDLVVIGRGLEVCWLM